MMLPLVLLASSTITVNLSETKPISPYIYGANFAPWKETGQTVTLDRQGGNRMSAYNWETNASNAGNDYRNQNDGYMGETDEPGWAPRTFMQEAQRNGSAVLLTVPTLGYVAADKRGDGDVGNTPDYLQTRFLRSYSHKPSTLVYPPNTTDQAVYQDEFVHWIESVKRPNTPVWFSLDNEPDLWGSTHSRVWKKNPTYAQIVANNVEFASAIKTQAPSALVFGPANYGWQGFRTFQGAPDANGREFMPFYLSSLRTASEKVGKRLLDVMDVHWYPEAKGGGQRIAWGEDKPGTAEARIQAPRSLWDPAYVEDSWIEDTIGHQPIRLLPRLMASVEKAWPGTKLGITEYNYGGGRVASGMLAQADVLGIYGREGLFAACVFGMGKDDVAQLAAFKAFRDFDGRGARFGSVGLAVRGAQAAAESVYAAREGNRITLVAINKTNADRSFAITIPGLRPTGARAFVRSEGDYLHPASVPVSVTAGKVSFATLPLSVVTVELRAR